MLTKMPTKNKSKTETSQANTKFFAGVVILFAVMGMAGGYVIFPLLQSPKVLTLTSNLTNNNTTPSNTVVKHSTKVTQSSGHTKNQNSTDNTNSKNTSNSYTSKQTSSERNNVQSSNKNNS